MADEYAEALIHQMVDPNHNGDLIRWFSKGQKSGIWKSENVFVANDTGDVTSDSNPYTRQGTYGPSYSSMTVVRPEAIGSITSTKGTSTTYYPMPVQAQLAPQAVVAQHVSMSATNNVFYISNPIIYNNEVMYPLPVAGNPCYPIAIANMSTSIGSSSTPNNNGFWIRGYATGTQANSEVQVNCDLINSNNEVLFTASGYFGGATTGYNGAVMNLISAEYYQQMKQVQVTDQANVAFLRIQLKSQNAIVDDFFQFTISNGGYLAGTTTFTIQYPNYAGHTIAQDLYQIDSLLPLIDDGFVVSQSMLCSYEGSTLNDAGLISTAYLNPHYWPGQYAKNPNSYYYYLASLNHDNYDGPLRHGSYCWWAPQDGRDMDSDNVGARNWKKPFLAAAWVGGYAGETVRVRITTIYQYYSENNMFDYSLGGCMVQTTPQFMFALGNVPHCSANGTHLELIRSWMKKVAKLCYTTLKNPNFWSGAAEVATTIASFL